MLKHLPTSIHSEYKEDVLLTAYTEQNSPTANAGFADAGTFSKRGRKPGIERVFGELDDPRPKTHLGWPVQTVENFSAS